MYPFRSVFPHMEVPVVASYDRHGVALGLFYSSAADIPLLSPVPTGGEPSQRGTLSRLLRQAWGRLGPILLLGCGNHC